MEKREIIYNTDVIRHYGAELEDLGYVSINKLLLTRPDRRLLINEAKKEHNNLALSGVYPTKIYVKQEFYNDYVIKNAEKDAWLDIKIESKDSEFIKKLTKFLARQKNVNFSVVSYLGVDLKNSNEEKIDFLSSNLIDMNLTSRAFKCLGSVDITYVFEIIDFRDNLMKIRNFGAHSLKEIKTEFAKRGLDFQYIPKELMEAAKLRRNYEEPD
jgi:predicted DNA binding CopG/RHH family protein